MNRIRYVWQPNKGLPGARNTGILQSRGSLLAFLDADDQWLAEKLSVQVPRLLDAGPRVALVHSDVTYLDVSTGDRFQAYRPRESFQGACYEELFFRNHVTPSTVIVKRECVEAVGLFDETLSKGCEDYDLWLRLAARYEFAYDPRQLTIYCLHGENMSRNALKMSEAILTVIDKALTADPCLSTRIGIKRVNQRMFGLCCSLGYQYLTRDLLTEARRQFSRALGYNAVNPHVWWLYMASFLPATLLRRVRWLKREIAAPLTRFAAPCC
jgi:glycosyltransferase involved in cell wall biosynthesis